MRKNIANDKVIKAITIGLATMIATTSVPVSVYADEEPSQPDNGGVETNNDSETREETSEAVSEAQTAAGETQTATESLETAAGEGVEAGPIAADVAALAEAGYEDKITVPIYDAEGAVVPGQTEEVSLGEEAGSMLSNDAAADANVDTAAGKIDTAAEKVESYVENDAKADADISTASSKMSEVQVDYEALNEIAEGANEGLTKAIDEVKSAGTISAVRDLVEQAQLDAEEAKANYDAKKLEYEAAMADYKTAVADYERDSAAAAASLNEAKTALGEATTALSTASTELNEAQAAADNLAKAAAAADADFEQAAQDAATTLEKANADVTTAEGNLSTAKAEQVTAQTNRNASLKEYKAAYADCYGDKDKDGNHIPGTGKEDAYKKAVEDAEKAKASADSTYSTAVADAEKAKTDAVNAAGDTYNQEVADALAEKNRKDATPEMGDKEAEIKRLYEANNGNKKPEKPEAYVRYYYQFDEVGKTLAGSSKIKNITIGDYSNDKATVTVTFTDGTTETLVTEVGDNEGGTRQQILYRDGQVIVNNAKLEAWLGTLGTVDTEQNQKDYDAAVEAAKQKKEAAERAADADYNEAIKTAGTTKQSAYDAAEKAVSEAKDAFDKAKELERSTHATYYSDKATLENANKKVGDLTEKLTTAQGLAEKAKTDKDKADADAKAFDKLREDAAAAKENLETAKQKVNTLQSKIDAINTNIAKGEENNGLNQTALTALKSALLKAEEELANAETTLNEISEKKDELLSEAAKRIRALTPDDDDDEEEIGGASGGVTYFETVTAPGALMAALPATGVAGVRVARGGRTAAAVTGGEQETGVAGVRAEKPAVKNEIKQEVKKAPKVKTTTIADPEVPLVAAPDETEHMSWWWLLLIAILGVTGEEIYRRNRKKKMEAQAAADSLNEEQ